MTPRPLDEEAAALRAALERIESLLARPVAGELTERERYILLEVRDTLKGRR